MRQDQSLSESTPQLPRAPVQFNTHSHVCGCFVHASSAAFRSRTRSNTPVARFVLFCKCYSLPTPDAHALHVPSSAQLLAYKQSCAHSPLDPAASLQSIVPHAAAANAHLLPPWPALALLSLLATLRTRIWRGGLHIGNTTTFTYHPSLPRLASITRHTQGHNIRFKLRSRSLCPGS